MATANTSTAPPQVSRLTFFSREFANRAVLILLFVRLATAADATLKSDSLLVTVDSRDGSYTIGLNADSAPILQATVGAQVNHQWIKSSDYPQHQVSESAFEDSLGRGRQVTVTSTGLPGRPALACTIRTYADRPFGDIQVAVENHTGKALTVESIRSVEATGERILNLHGEASSERVLSDSFSEDWPPFQIYDLGKAPNGMHRAVGSQLIYNQQSKESVFFGTLTADRLLTIFHLKTQSVAASPTITNFSVDSTGTTEIQATEEGSGVREGSKENLVELSLPLPSGGSISSERLMFAGGTDYHAQLENYGTAIRELHRSRIPEGNMLGWWSWTAFYMKITEGNAFTNALWQAEHLKDLGYDWFHFDFGYGYARGDYSTPNASKFPHGMRPVTQRINQLGLNVGIWTAPFEVGEFSSIYQQHKDWLVHNASGNPIQVTTDEEVRSEKVFALDTTNPAAQEFLRQTYRTLVREWQVKYIKLDFMDTTAIEGYFYRPHTTALEALRIGLQVIRDAVGDNVLLDKDGSPMLTPVGIVDDGRVSQDTGHTFQRSKEADPGIAARYYMHRNFFINDPDAFTVSRQVIEEREIQAPLSLDEAKVSIALSAVSGGMYEIGDDLPTLGADADRLALLKNPDLLQMAKLGRASVPLDLLTYRPEDEQPSVFVLREDQRQSVLTVFNWTEKPATHHVSLSQLKLPNGGAYEFHDVLDQQGRVPLDGDSIELAQPAHSVKLIKIIDTSVPAAAPIVDLRAPDHAKVWEEIEFVATAASNGVPALAYHWDFGDGTTDERKRVTHTFTKEGNHMVRLVVDGLDGVPAEKSTTVAVRGTVAIPPPSHFSPKE